ncbi:hypothetical protein SDC9_178048 [bioreactor metagenome]|uniref:Uncharacterized protein n=1 Tax=bioreactor metagenome TaxID=1076179 RepID=A0A645GV09_9ZZZZ
MGHIVQNADRKVIFRLRLTQIGIYGGNLAGSSILGGQTIAPTDYLNVAATRLLQGALHIQIQRLAHGAGLFGAVQHGNLFAGGGDGVNKVLHGEGTIQVYLHHADLAAMRIQIIHGITHGFRAGTHDDGNLLGIGSAVVVKQFVVPAGETVNLVHVVLHDTGNGGNFFVGTFLALEEYIRINGGAAGGGMLRV